MTDAKYPALPKCVWPSAKSTSCSLQNIKTTTKQDFPFLCSSIHATGPSGPEPQAYFYKK